MTAPPIRCFVSYAQQDDLVLQFVDPFVEALRLFAYSDRGRELEIFVDRDSIGWGEDVQTKIEDSVASAQVFMPIITRRYFDRPYCRLEFLAFHNQAEVLGAGSLLLPVVLLGRSHLTEDASDPIVRVVSRLLQRDLEEAWLEGPGSGVWRRAVLALARELVDRVDRAETALADRAAAPDDAAPGLTDVTEALDLFGRETMALMTLTAQVIDSVGDLLHEGTSAEQSVVTRPYGVELQRAGRDYRNLTNETDRVLRQYVESVRRRGSAQQVAKLRAGLRRSTQSLESLAQLEHAIEELLVSMRPAESASAALRKSLHGFRDGMTAISSALVMTRLWTRIADDL